MHSYLSMVSIIILSYLWLKRHGAPQNARPSTCTLLLQRQNLEVHASIFWLLQGHKVWLILPMTFISTSFINHKSFIFVGEFFIHHCQNQWLNSLKKSEVKKIWHLWRRTISLQVWLLPPTGLAVIFPIFPSWWLQFAVLLFGRPCNGGKPEDKTETIDFGVGKLIAFNWTNHWKQRVRWDFSKTLVLLGASLFWGLNAASWQSKRAEQLSGQIRKFSSLCWNPSQVATQHLAKSMKKHEKTHVVPFHIFSYQ